MAGFYADALGSFFPTRGAVVPAAPAPLETADEPAAFGAPPLTAALESPFLASAAVDFTGAAAAGFLPSVSITKNGFPTSTPYPSAAKISVITPASGDLIGTYVLSVSTLQTISSSST